MGDWRDDFRREVTYFYPEECQFLDFKAGWGNILTVPKKLWDMLIKPLIALGNTSRKTGRECFLVFGIHDKGRVILSLVNKFPVPSWRNKIEPDWDFDYIATDLIWRRLKPEVSRYINPDITGNIEFHTWTYSEGGNRIAYLRITPPENDRGHYRLSQRLHTLTAHTALVREGDESKVVTDTSKLSSIHAAAYLTRKQWYALARSNMIDSTPFPYLSDISPIDAVISALSSGTRRIMITGKGGSGKSRLIDELAYRYSFKHQLANEEIFGLNPLSREGLEWNFEMTSPLPIRIRLRGESFNNRDSMEASFARQIAHYADDVDTSALLPLNRLWGVPGSQWLVLIDGLDELPRRSQRVLGAWVNSVGAPNVQIVITARELQQPLNNFQEFDIEPPQPEHVKQVFDQLLAPLPDIDLLNTDKLLAQYSEARYGPELFAFLTNLRMLNAFIESFVPIVVSEETSPTKLIDPLESDEPHFAPEMPQKELHQDGSSLAILKDELVDSTDFAAETGSDHQVDESLEANTPIEQVDDREDELVDSTDFAAETGSDHQVDESLEVNIPMTMRSLTNALIAAEIRRRSREELIISWGVAEKVAWKSDWTVCYARCSAAQNTKLAVLEQLGLIRRGPNTCEFQTKLFLHYMAAEHSLGFGQQMGHIHQTRLGSDTTEAKVVREFRDNLHTPRIFP